MGTHFTMPVQLATVNQMSAWIQIDSANLIAAEANRLKSTVEKVMDVCTAYDVTRQAVSIDSELSFAGQQASKRRAAEAGAEKIKALCDPFLNELSKRAGTLAAKLANTVTATPDANMVALMIERRSILSSMDELGRQLIYTQVCQDNSDELTALAFEQAPTFMKLLTPEVLELGKAMRAAAADPEAADQLEKVRMQHEILALSRNAALRELAQQQDTLAEQARGQRALTPDDEADE